MLGWFAVLGFCLFVCTYAMEACVLASQGRISSMNQFYNGRSNAANSAVLWAENESEHWPLTQRLITLSTAFMQVLITYWDPVQTNNEKARGKVLKSCLKMFNI